MHTATSITIGNWQGLLNHGAAPRELECLLAIAGGASGKEVARALGISEDGVKKRLLALGTKWGVTRRAALVAEGFKRGVISQCATAMILLLCVAITAQQTSTEQLGRTRRPGERRIETRVAVRRIEAAQTV